MTRLDVPRSAAVANASSAPDRLSPALRYQAGYSDSLALVHMEAFLLQLVGHRGTRALLQRSRQRCGRYASSAALSHGLLRLCSELLGERLAQRMLQPAHTTALPQTQDLAQQLVQANEQLVLSALNAQAIGEAAISSLDQLARTSQRDALTDTPNRALLLDRLESALAMAQRRGTRVAVLFLDVDHFKQINDTLGHATGDAVLQWVARRLQAAVRDSDAVGRQGGDEFLVLLAEVSRMSDAAQIARKIIGDMAMPTLVCGHLLHVSVSVGVAVYPDDAQDASTLIGLADTAMYRSKRRGGGSLTFYGEPLHAAGTSDPNSEPYS